MVLDTCWVWIRHDVCIVIHICLVVPISTQRKLKSTILILLLRLYLLVHSSPMINHMVTHDNLSCFFETIFCQSTFLILLVLFIWDDPARPITGRLLAFLLFRWLQYLFLSQFDLCYSIGHIVLDLLGILNQKDRIVLWLQLGWVLIFQCWISLIWVPLLVLSLTVPSIFTVV